MERMNVDADKQLVSAGVMGMRMRIRYVRNVRKVAVVGEFNRTSDELSTR